jgi:TATA-box binding protein (TBP) (component of TFIID and TFIIIB)
MCIICDPKNKYNDCICCPKWKSFDKTLCKIKNDDSHEMVKEILRISTITLCSNFNCDIKLSDFSSYYKNSIKYTPRTKNKTHNNSFYNSLLMNISVKYQPRQKVSIKFFPNGKIQIAGLQTIKACAYCIRKAFRRLVNKDCFIKNSESQPKITDTRIVMINSDFKIKNNIYQDKLCAVLLSNGINSDGNFVQVGFNPSKYPAINTKIVSDSNKDEYISHHGQYGIKKKYKKFISMLIFRSGSIIITGGDDLNDYLNVYSKIIILLSQNKNLLY